MLNLKNIALKPKTVKVIASNHFLHQLSDIGFSADKQKDDKVIPVDNYSIVYSEAVSLLKTFVSANGFDQKSFEKAADKLAEASKLKPSKVEPYYYLAWLFQFVKDSEMALKYLKVAIAINPKLPGIEQLKENIISSQLKSVKNIQNQPAVVKNNEKITPIQNATNISNRAASAYSKYK